MSTDPFCSRKPITKPIFILGTFTSINVSHSVHAGIAGHFEFQRCLIQPKFGVGLISNPPHTFFAGSGIDNDMVLQEYTKTV